MHGVWRVLLVYIYVYTRTHCDARDSSRGEQSRNSSRVQEGVC
jgi:hypothetical protein